MQSVRNEDRQWGCGPDPWRSSDARVRDCTVDGLAPRMTNGEVLHGMQKKKLVILAAITGGSQQDRDGAKVPCTPAEIADEALRCYNAGAAVVHIHARDEKDRKQPTGDLSVFKDIINRIRDKCDILIQTTNGIGSRRDPVTGKIIRPTEEERLAVISIEPRQDLYSIAGGSWDFYHPGVPARMNSLSPIRPNFCANTFRE